MTKYCVGCGQKHDYSLESPRFCSNCGKSFGGVQEIVKKEVFAKKKVVSDEQEEDSEKEVPQISKIEVELEETSASKIKFGDAKKSASFARERPTLNLTPGALSTRLDKLFEYDRQNTKEDK